jgi:hypothetical protein
MSDSLKKLWNDYGIAGILIIVVGLYVLHMMYKYFSNKGSSSGMPEGNTNNNNNAYNNQPSSSVMPAVENQSDEFASTSGSQQMMSAGAGSCGANTTNPADLLPKDNNNDWSKLNPSGSGPLSNINLLKAGALIGIDTIGQTLRNANLQIRSEPPNPQLSVGPWNQSTITPDFMRPPMEIGQGAQ